MVKEKDIVVRVDLELKNLIKKVAEDAGLTSSSYVRHLIIRELKSLGLK
jgi:antitoxin component of RelBE/YafQ-DinJ toxin-antitoxin module